MILKIERYMDYNDNVVSDDWWMIDSIEKISRHMIENHPFNKDFDSAEADIFLLDYERYLEKNQAGQSGRDVLSLICRRYDHSEFRVLFDTIAYALNNDGKTIEKLVANYRFPQA